MIKRVYLVGLHNKPNTPPLHSKTKSGKLVDRIIDSTSKGEFRIEFIKTNLFDIEYYPTNDDENFARATEWWKRNEDITDADVIVLLGAAVHRDFVNVSEHKKVVKLAHPASIWSKQKQDDYVFNACIKIIKKMYHDSH